MDLKQRIIEIASKLFFRNGIKGITMSDIAAETGISKRTLYENFSDKEQLLEQCILTHSERGDAEIARLTESADNVIGVLMRFHSMQLTEMWSVGRTIVRDLKKYHIALYKRIEFWQREKIFRFIPLLEKGVKQGLIRNDIPFEIMLWLLQRQFKMLMEDETIPAERYSFDDFIHAATLSAIRGIATPLGVEKIDEIFKQKNKKQ
ncbi:MAG: TetR/AcrR family transcriptional regulator [Dysgonamonadaceae bacterium]|jgi:AcrR family transcriptional regulator|nr:TetR/AcrR family transcriptional regulator [Dysgonamonadaceae bacterium]